MARPERPIEGDGPLARFAGDLRELRRRAGRTYRDMALLVGVSPSALAQAASGAARPTWNLTHAYVRACGGDIAYWRQRWTLLPAEEEARREKHGQNRPQPQSDRIQFHLLGPVRITDPDGAEVALLSRRERAILAVLLLSDNRIVSRLSLIQRVWSDSEMPGSVLDLLYKYASSLRRALVDSCSDARLVAESEGYLLEVPQQQVDLRQFKLLIQQGRRCRNDDDLQAASRIFRRALDLWKGEPLTGITGEGMMALKLTLSEQRRTAYGELLVIDARLGRYVEVIENTARASADEPLNERLACLRMLALHLAGRRLEALQVYRDVWQRLHGVGLDPSNDLQQIHHAVLDDNERALHSWLNLRPVRGHPVT